LGSGGGGRLGEVKHDGAVGHSGLRDRAYGSPVVDPSSGDRPPHPWSPDAAEQCADAGVGADQADLVDLADQDEIGHPHDPGSIGVQNLAIEQVAGERDQSVLVRGGCGWRPEVVRYTSHRQMPAMPV
jgi:hypothetical protein